MCNFNDGTVWKEIVYCMCIHVCAGCWEVSQGDRSQVSSIGHGCEAARHHQRGSRSDTGGAGPHWCTHQQWETNTSTHADTEEPCFGLWDSSAVFQINFLPSFKKRFHPISMFVAWRIFFLSLDAAGNFLCPASSLSFNAFKTVLEIDTMGTFNASKVVYEKWFKVKSYWFEYHIN